MIHLCGIAYISHKIYHKENTRMKKFLLIFALAFAGFMKPAQAEPSVDQTVCLADIIFFETHGAPIRDKLLVGNVVLNRMDDDRFPKTVCDIKNQTEPVVQFPWIKLSREQRVQIVLKDIDEYTLSLFLATQLLEGKYFDNSHGALFFKAHWSKQIWGKKLVFVMQTKYHMFYKLRE